MYKYASELRADEPAIRFQTFSCHQAGEIENQEDKEAGKYKQAKKSFPI
jgi:hypothetical protein